MKKASENSRRPSLHSRQLFVHTAAPFPQGEGALTGVQPAKAGEVPRRPAPTFEAYRATASFALLRSTTPFPRSQLKSRM